jgi:hypothetical protein
MLVKVPLLGTIGTLNATFKNSVAKFKQISSIFHNRMFNDKIEWKTHVKCFFFIFILSFSNMVSKPHCSCYEGLQLQFRMLFVF